MKNNTSRYAGALITAFAIALFAVHLSRAQTASTDNPRKAWASFTKAYGANWRASWDKGLGTPTELKGGHYAALPGDPEQVSRSFLSQNRDLFRINTDLSDLTVERLKHSPMGSHVFFNQSYQGLPVFDGGVDVHINQANEVVLVHNRYATSEALSHLALTPTT